MEMIDWGLRYIERLRKAHYEEAQKSATRGQMYAVLGVGILNIIATIAAAILRNAP